jgi:heme-degrading monooxygenase HmoA
VAEVFARVSEVEARPERLDEMHSEGVEHILPALRMQEGFNGGLVLADRKSGKVLAVTFWESEQAMDITEEAAHWLLTFGTETAGGTIKDVERYEVFFAEVKGTQR